MITSQLIADARKRGFLVMDHPLDPKLVDEENIWVQTADVWAQECFNAGRHAILTGHDENKHEHIVMVIKNPRQREFKYLIFALFAVLRELDEDPDLNPNRGVMWVKAKSKDQALAAASRLAEIDREPRDPTREFWQTTAIHNEPIIAA